MAPGILEVQLQQFSGPLDLLLNLLAEQKLTITDISLSQITEQYFRYLDSVEQREPEELADFLVVATKLLLLKSQALLPFLHPEEIDEVTLTAQLRLYKAFVDVSRHLTRAWEARGTAVWRFEPPRRSETFVPPLGVTLDAFQASMIQLLRRLQPIPPLTISTIDRAISMKEKMDRIRALLSRQTEMNFHELIESAMNRTDMIVSFLAMLELMKQEVILVRQTDLFGDITLVRV